MDVIDVQALPLERWLQRHRARIFRRLPAGRRRGGKVRHRRRRRHRPPAPRRRHPGAAPRHAGRCTSAPARRGCTCCRTCSSPSPARCPGTTCCSATSRLCSPATATPGRNPGDALTMPELAQEFGIAANLLARSRDQWLSRDLWDDATPGAGLPRRHAAPVPGAAGARRRREAPSSPVAAMAAGREGRPRPAAPVRHRRPHQPHQCARHADLAVPLRAQGRRRGPAADARPAPGVARPRRRARARCATRPPR